jgi:hypothetical protein
MHQRGKNAQFSIHCDADARDKQEQIRRLVVAELPAFIEKERSCGQITLSKPSAMQSRPIMFGVSCMAFPGMDDGRSRFNSTIGTGS